jgi:pilus assembly protein CpaB
MNRRLLSILLFALVVSGGASYLVYRLAGDRMNSGSQAPTTRVVVASRNLDIGVLIQHADVKMGEWVGPLPNGTAVKKEAVVGRGVISALYEGEPVRENRLAPVGSGGGLAATIPQGMRACAVCAVKVNEVVGVAGFVIPGRRVDVASHGLVGRGLSNRQIASALKISECTVKRHLRNIYGKLGVGARTQLALVRHGLPVGDEG